MSKKSRRERRYVRFDTVAALPAVLYIDDKQQAYAYDLGALRKVDVSDVLAQAVVEKRVKVVPLVLGKWKADRKAMTGKRYGSKQKQQRGTPEFVREGNPVPDDQLDRSEGRNSSQTATTQQGDS